MTRRFNFAVHLTAAEPDDEGIGWTQDEIVQLLKSTLDWYGGPLHRDRDSVRVSWELLSVEQVPALKHSHR